MSISSPLEQKIYNYSNSQVSGREAITKQDPGAGILLCLPITSYFTTQSVNAILLGVYINDVFLTYNKKYKDMKTAKITPSFSSIILILIGVFPLGIGAIVAANNYSLHKNPYPLIMLILAILFVGFLLPSTITLKPAFRLFTSISIFLLAMASRYFSIITLRTNPTSDFGWVLINAPKFMDHIYKNHYSINNPHWGLYNITISEFFKIFPHSLTTIQNFNIILAGITAIGIYFLGKNIFCSEKIGLLSSIIYILYPADILYKSLPTGDHIFIAVLPYIFILFHTALQSDLKSKRNLILFLVLGLLVGLVDLYKPVGIVLIIALAITILLVISKPSPNKISGFIWILVIIIGFIFTRSFGSSILEYRTSLQIQPTYLFRSLRIGTDIQNSGMWNDQTSRHIEKIISENDSKSANRILMDEVLNNLSINGPKLPTFFYNKFEFVWKSDYDFYFWSAVNRASSGTPAIDDFIQSKLPYFVDSYHLAILIFSAIGLFFAGFSKKNNPLFTAMSLFVFGIALLLMITEIQQRYRSILLSILPIFASYGVYGFQVMVGSFKRMKIRPVREIIKSPE